MRYLAIVVLLTSVLTMTHSTVTRNTSRVHEPQIAGAIDQGPIAPSPAATSTYLWEPLPLPTGVTTTSVNAIAVHPSNAGTVFLASTNGLYKSIDTGQTWNPVAPAMLNNVFDVVIAPNNPLRLYVRSWNLYRSDDGGGTWNPIPSPPSNCGMSVAPSNADRLYARSCGWDHTPAVFRSIDGGQTWITPTLNFTQTLDTLVVAPDQPDVLIASTFDTVFRSPDGGNTWTATADGTRYFGRPAFDPNPPYTLYLGHWTGLLRCADTGQTWEDSGAAREFSALVVSPFFPNEVLGGNSTSTWRVVSHGSSWTASAWDAPLPLQSLWRGAHDSRALYASAASGFWRFVRRDRPYAVFLPSIQRAEPAGVFPLAAQQALNRANLYRAQVGIIPLRLYAAIVAAAQHHADYYMLNYSDASAWTYGPHGEVQGKPGYTGQWPSDRINAAGFPWGGGSEVMHFIGDPVASVDGWLSTIYHRIIVLDPGAHFTGYGNGKNSLAAVAVDVMDFGGGPTDNGMWSPAQPYPQAYPTDGQTGLPASWDGGESPDPLPPGATRPVGYPFTLQGVGGTLQVDGAELKTAGGQLVPTHPNPPDCPAFNCYALIAISPLQPNTTYKASVHGNVGGIAFNQTWTFITGAANALLSNARPLRFIGPPHR